MAVPLTEQAIDAIASAVFEKPGALVLEAYSDLDKEPRQFASAQEFAHHVKDKISRPRESAFVFVVYPDMAGRAVRKTIHLDPAKVPGHSVRYTWEGWGLISIHLERGDAPRTTSRVAANSAKRAAKWASTYPDWEPPSTWNWKAVESHARRLQRVLKNLA